MMENPKKYISSAATHPPNLDKFIPIDINKHGPQYDDLKIEIKNKYNINTIKYENDTIDSKNINDCKIIPSKKKRWEISVPILYKNETKWMKMLADTAADTPCANLFWANQHYKKFINKDRKPKTVDTPNGITKNKYCIYFSFPAYNGRILKSKFILLPTLPTNILADINMLEAFGYKFSNGVPPVFQHIARKEIDLEIKENDEKFKTIKTDIQRNCNNAYKLINNDGTINAIKTITLSEKIKCFDKIIHDESNIQIDDSIYEYNSLFTKIDKDENDMMSPDTAPHSIQFITANQTFKATPEEINKAKQMNYNRKLIKPDWKYIELYERWKPKKYKNLYNLTMETINEFNDVFAKYTCDRRTFNVEPVKLGIKPGYENKQIRTAQYPLSSEKRISMIAYTLEMDKSEFWLPIKTSINNNPYTITLKKPDAAGVIRGRPALDMRKLNEICVLMESHMPTIKDFDQFYSQPGLITAFDFKNCFDCIPLCRDEWKFAVIESPIGLRMLMHLSYGFKNAAPIAQRIMNDLCAKLNNAMGYLDDGSIKHPMELNTVELVNELRQFLQCVRELNAFINIEKFFPFCTEIESLGIRRHMHGSGITELYTKKILALQKPYTVNDLRTSIGVLIYIARYIYMFSYYSYWLVQLVLIFENKTRIIWSREANEAWEAIRYLVQRAPILYTPKKTGIYCLKPDACMYAFGGVLYQKQKFGNEFIWRIIDMYSGIMPKHMRDTHCRLQEAFGVVKLTQHWTPYLLPARFIIATDHKPLIQMFGDNYDLSTTVLRQLLRLRIALAEFTFTIQHVKGVDNEMADLLSRLRLHLIKVYGKQQLFISGDYGTKLQPVLSQNEQTQLDKELNQLKNKLNNIKREIKYAKTGNFNNNDNKINTVNLLNLANNVYKDITNDILRQFVSKDKTRLIDIIYSENDFIPDYKYYDLVTPNQHQNIIQLINKIDKLNPSQIEFIDKQISDTLNINTICAVTRSMKKNKPKPQYIDSDLYKLQNKSKLRKMIVTQLFHNRDINILFQFDKWAEFQKSDEILSIIYKFITNKNTFLQNKDLNKQWQELKKQQRFLTRQAENGKINFNNKFKILQIKRYNYLENSDRFVYIVPTCLRGICLKFSHNNLTRPHFNQESTQYEIEKWFWWPRMRDDIRNHISRCPVCQFGKGGPQHKTPMRIRDLPEAGELLLGDYMGPFFKKYYILVLIDYKTGFTVLYPTSFCGAISAAEAILTKWIPYFGLFEKFESDMGSAFTSKLFTLILNSMELKQGFAEPRFHQGIGKVERVIGFIQNILRIYNIEFNNKFVSTNRATIQWMTIKAILPLIQFSINKHRSKFTTFSPALLMYGKQFRDISDLAKTINSLEKGYKTLNKDDDREYLDELIENLKDINKQYKNNWKKNVLISKSQYDEKYNLKPIRDEKGVVQKQKHSFGYQPIEKFVKGLKVLYYVGPLQGVNGKWSQTWTGPWTITKQIFEGKFEISDSNGKTKDVSGDRLKLFKTVEKDNYHTYDEYEKTMKTLTKHHENIQDEQD